LILPIVKISMTGMCHMEVQSQIYILWYMTLLNHHLKPFCKIQCKYINVASSSKDKTQHTLQIWDCLSHHILGQLKDLNQAMKCTVHLLGAKPSTTED
jgi:hypothetical protein